MTTESDRLAATESALSHPYYIMLAPSWAESLTAVGFQTEDEARRFAGLRPEPIISLWRRVGQYGYPENIANRVTERPPRADPDNYAWQPRDDFPDTRETVIPFTVERLARAMEYLYANGGHLVLHVEDYLPRGVVTPWEVSAARVFAADRDVEKARG